MSEYTEYCFVPAGDLLHLRERLRAAGIACIIDNVATAGAFTIVAVPNDAGFDANGQFFSHERWPILASVCPLVGHLWVDEGEGGAFVIDVVTATERVQVSNDSVEHREAAARLLRVSVVALQSALQTRQVTAVCAAIGVPLQWMHDQNCNRPADLDAVGGAVFASDLE